MEKKNHTNCEIPPQTEEKLVLKKQRDNQLN